MKPNATTTTETPDPAPLEEQAPPVAPTPTPPAPPATAPTEAGEAAGQTCREVAKKASPDHARPCGPGRGPFVHSTRAECRS